MRSKRLIPNDPTMMCVWTNKTGNWTRSLSWTQRGFTPVKIGCEDTQEGAAHSGQWKMMFKPLGALLLWFGLADPDAIPQWDKVGVGSSSLRNVNVDSATCGHMWTYVDPHMALSLGYSPKKAIFIGTMIIHQWS